MPALRIHRMQAALPIYWAYPAGCACAVTEPHCNNGSVHTAFVFFPAGSKDDVSVVRTQPEPGMEGSGEAAVRAGPSPGMPGVDAMLDATRGEGICLARAEPCGKFFRCGSSAHGWDGSGMRRCSHGWQGARHQSAEVRHRMPAAQHFCPLHCNTAGA